MKKELQNTSAYYNLNKLLKPYNFPTDPKDNIKNVRITKLKLRTYNGECCITLKVPDNGARTIYQVVSRWIDSNNSIVDSLTIYEVSFDVEFDSKIIAVKLDSSGYCNLSNDTKEELLISNKYLQYWGLIK